MLLRSIALSLMLLTAAQEARAESSPYKPCTKTPTPSDIEGAKGLHLAAKQYLAKGEYKRAVETWNEAYGFDCTKPEVFINIGKSYEGLGDTAKAVVAYRTYVERKGAQADQETVAKVKSLEEKLAAQAKSTPVTPTPVGPTEAEGPTNDLLPGETEGQPTVGPGPWPWVVTGAGAALLFTGSVMLGIGSGKITDAEAVCPNRVCPSAAGGPDAATVNAALDDGNSGLRLQRIGASLLGVGVAAVGGGLTWYFVSRPSKTEPSMSRRWQVLPELAPGHYGVSTRLAF